MVLNWVFDVCVAVRTVASWCWCVLGTVERCCRLCRWSSYNSLGYFCNLTVLLCELNIVIEYCPLLQCPDCLLKQNQLKISLQLLMLCLCLLLTGYVTPLVWCWHCWSDVVWSGDRWKRRPSMFKCLRRCDQLMVVSMVTKSARLDVKWRCCLLNWDTNCKQVVTWLSGLDSRSK